MTEAFDIQPFTERVFEAEAAAVRAGLVAAGLMAHDWSMAAQVGSGRPTGEPYGATFWKALPDEVGKLVCQLLDGARMHKPRNAQYNLILWNGMLILPVKIKPRGKRDPRSRITTSDLRRTLTSVNMPAAPEKDLFVTDEEEALLEFEEAAIAVIEKAKYDLDNVVSQVIIVAYECARRGGLQSVEVGFGNLDHDGYIVFSDSEPLSVIPPAEGSKPVEAVGESWTNSTKPPLNLEARDEDVTATGEDEPAADPDDRENPGTPKTE